MLEHHRHILNQLESMQWATQRTWEPKEQLDRLTLLMITGSKRIMNGLMQNLLTTTTQSMLRKIKLKPACPQSESGWA
mgnify:CR=1 FL=1